VRRHAHALADVLTDAIAEIEWFLENATRWTPLLGRSAKRNIGGNRPLPTYLESEAARVLTRPEARLRTTLLTALGLSTVSSAGVGYDFDELKVWTKARARGFHFRSRARKARRFWESWMGKRGSDVHHHQ
jgi:hypothetical protein